MEAIVLAGGRGTRLRSVVSGIPKPMAPINDRPFLSFVLDFLIENEVDRIILSVGYKWELIYKHFGDNYRGREIVYSVEKEPLGTGGGIRLALEHTNLKNLFVINGDTYFDIDLSKMILPSDAQVVLSLKKMHNFDRYGCIEVDKDGYVVEFTEKSFREEGAINGGIYLISSKLLDNFTIGEAFSFEKFLEQQYKYKKIKTVQFDDYFIDIGIPEDYQQFQTYRANSNE